MSAGRARGRVLPIHSASRPVEHPVGVRRFGQGRDWHATPLAARGQTGTVPVFTAIQRRDPRDDLFAVLCLCEHPGLLAVTEPKAAAARRSHRDNRRNLILALKATLKGPRLAPGARLKIDLEDHGVTGVSGQQPHPIFRPERASPQGYQGLKAEGQQFDPAPDYL